MIQASGIHKVYKNGEGAVHALEDVSVSVQRGAFVCLVGPSGAGKSTLLHIIGGLDSPTQGRVLLDGRDIYGLNDIQLGRLRNSAIGFVFQFYHLLPEFTVLENVLMPALIARQYGCGEAGLQQRRRAQSLLEEVGLGKRMEHFPSELSGGEQQRASLCRALINQPQLLLCDEPTGNLDTDSGRAVIAMIKALARSRQMTVVMATHNLEIAESSDTIYHLRDGRLAGR